MYGARRIVLNYRCHFHNSAFSSLPHEDLSPIEGYKGKKKLASGYLNNDG